MNILLIGGGGREHALAWKILQSPLVEKLYCAPGNPGTEEMGALNIDIGIDNIDGLLEIVQEIRIDLTVCAKESPPTLLIR